VTPDPDPIPTSTGQPVAAGSPGTDGSPSAQAAPAAGGPSVTERASSIANERPEVAVGAAFGGGLLLALILKRLVG
jgi:hypothetical protein